MAVEKVFKCDLCGEFVTKDELATVRVGLREWRPEDYVVVDVGRCCAGRPIADLIAHAQAQPEWTEVMH